MDVHIGTSSDLAIAYKTTNTPYKECVLGPTDFNDYFYFKASYGNCNIGLTSPVGLAIVLEYSYDKVTWQPWTYTDNSTSRSFSTITLTNGRTLYIRGNNSNGFATSTSSYSNFTTTARVDCGGNIMSLLDKTLALNSLNGLSYCFCNLFRAAKIVTAPRLPATTLASYCYSYMFYSCSYLLIAPELPSITLTDNCYSYMFYACRDLMIAPELPATTLASYCYTNMFNGCYVLVNAPRLPATTLANRCYFGMFQNCQSLETTPDIKITSFNSAIYVMSSMFAGCISLKNVSLELPNTLADYCCRYMFNGCTSLKKAPALPSTNLANYCYAYMFARCTSLEEMPELPATGALNNHCYEYMFSGCTSIKKATLPNLITQVGTGSLQYMFQGCTSLEEGPRLLTALTLASSCYAGMFQNCSSLRKAPIIIATDLPSGAFSNMFNGCTLIDEVIVNTSTWNTTNASNWLANTAASGTVYCVRSSGIPTNSASGVPSGWKLVGAELVIEPDDPSVSMTVQTVAVGSKRNIQISYSTNEGVSWNTANIGDVLPITIGANQRLLLRGITNGGLTNNRDASNYWYFHFSRNVNLDGFLHALHYANGGTIIALGYAAPTYAYNRLFASSYVIDASKLKIYGVPSAYYCEGLFNNCWDMTLPPEELSASAMAEGCYKNMFDSCANLTKTPKLPATTLAEECYQNMFANCEQLVDDITDLPALTVPTGAYASMFSSCTNLKKAPELPATTLYYESYVYMFFGCSSLEIAPPELPASSVPQRAYAEMFSECTSLEHPPVLYASSVGQHGCYGMFMGCTALKNTPESVILQNSGANAFCEMFNGCSSITKSPGIFVVGTSQGNDCVSRMFANCVKLKEIYWFGQFNTSWSSNWVYHVANSGDFYTNNSSIPTGVNGKPSGWSTHIVS